MTGTEYWRNLILSLGYISHIWCLHFWIYETYPCLLASFCLFGWEAAVWILVEIFTRDLFPHLQWIYDVVCLHIPCHENRDPGKSKFSFSIYLHHYHEC